MQTLTGRDIVHIWEAGLRQHPLDRALTILTAAFPGVPIETLITLSVGQRDSCLLAVREQTFGPRLIGLVACPACQERVEIGLDITQLRIAPSIRPGHNVQSALIEEFELHFRLPDSRDLAAIVGCADSAQARALLVRRCVVQALHNESEIAVEALPETAIAALAEQMDQRDPLAEILLDLDCPTCGHCWHILFDIVTFFWAEISAQAKRLLREVDTIARVYGWREVDILSMSSTRRRFYLELVT